MTKVIKKVLSVLMAVAVIAAVFADMLLYGSMSV